MGKFVIKEAKNNEKEEVIAKQIKYYIIIKKYKIFYNITKNLLMRKVVWLKI